MSEFKLGDRVFIDGRKFVVIDIEHHHPLGMFLTAVNENEDDFYHSVNFSNNDFKPIKKCYAILGEKK